MATTLVVGIWSVDTVSQGRKSWLAKPLYEKLAQLNKALEAFKLIRQAQNNVANPPDQLVRAVFAAPEYFFTEANSAGDRDYLSGTWLNWLKVRMPAQPGVLLVPGSIAYKKEATQARRTKYTLGVQALNGHAPHDELANLQKLTKTAFIHNVAYGFLGGNKVLKSRKQSAATDGRGANDPEAFVPGWATNKATCNVISTNGARTLSFGIEICADASKEHGARTGYIDLANPNAVNVKILVSAVLPSDSVYTGNYTDCLIHACSDPAHSGVRVKGNVQSVVISQTTQSGFPLDYYSVTIP